MKLVSFGVLVAALVLTACEKPEPMQVIAPESISFRDQPGGLNHGEEMSFVRAMQIGAFEVAEYRISQRIVYKSPWPKSVKMGPKTKCTTEGQLLNDPGVIMGYGGPQAVAPDPRAEAIGPLWRDGPQKAAFVHCAEQGARVVTYAGFRVTGAEGGLVSLDKTALRRLARQLCENDELLARFPRGRVPARVGAVEARHFVGRCA